jgi:hypothetical protein
VGSNPILRVTSTRNPPLNGSQAIHPSYVALACLQPAITGNSIRSRWLPEIPLMSKTVSGTRRNLYAILTARLTLSPEQLGPRKHRAR